MVSWQCNAALFPGGAEWVRFLGSLEPDLLLVGLSSFITLVQGPCTEYP